MHRLCSDLSMYELNCPKPDVTLTQTMAREEHDREPTVA
jgi:hypothetical protein